MIYVLGHKQKKRQEKQRGKPRKETRTASAVIQNVTACFVYQLLAQGIIARILGFAILRGFTSSEKDTCYALAVVVVIA